MKKRHPLGVIHGRFQVPHLDHLRYLLDGKSRCEHLVVGITNPDPSHVRPDPADPRRDRPEANPLTYYERQVLLRATLLDADVSQDAFTITPLPINMPELYRHYVPLEAVFFLSIYDDWGRRKLALFQSLGLRAEVMRDVAPEEKGLSSTTVRDLMAEGGDWEPLAPQATIAIMKAWDVPGRLRRMRTP